MRAEIFDSPVRGKRVPGVSVLTPARNGKEEELGWDSDSDDGMLAGMSPPKTMQFYVPQSRLLKTPGEFCCCCACLLAFGLLGGLSGWGEDGLTIVCAIAREASKRIVEGLLMTAGGDVTESLGEEDSPSVVGRGGMLEEDTF